MRLWCNLLAIRFFRKNAALCFWFGLLLSLAIGCKEDIPPRPGGKTQKQVAPGNVRLPAPTSRQVGQVVKKPTAPDSPPVPDVRKAPPAVRWYQPTFRERRFRAPRARLKKIPGVRAIPPTIIEHGSRRSKMVALTFDACSWNTRPRYDRKVIETLIKTRTPATLFMGGMWVLKRQQDARRLASYPFFEIANHSHLHGHLTKVSAKRLHHELLWTQEIIYTVLGQVPTLFRPPFLEFDKRVAKAAGKLGLKTINGLASGDPDPTFTKVVLVRYMKKAIQPGSIVVMHMNKGGKHTAEALPEIIANIKRKGYQMVTVSKLLSQK